MKKLLFLSFAAALSFCPVAGAQVFNHLALGAGIGTDGLAFEVAAPLGRHVQVRAGYGTALGLIGYTVKDISVPEHPGNSASANVNVPLKVNLGMSDARLLFNIYPSAEGGFHFTVGAFLGSPNVARTEFTNMPSDYNNVGIDVGGYLVKASSGTLKAGLGGVGLGGETFAVKPYVGIGFGRAIRDGKRVSFTFDLGAQYQGKVSLWARGEGVTGRTRTVRLTEKEFSSLKDVDKYASYATFWPTLNFRVYVKLF